MYEIKLLKEKHKPNLLYVDKKFFFIKKIMESSDKVGPEKP